MEVDTRVERVCTKVGINERRTDFAFWQTQWIPVNFIDLDNLRNNKKATGRAQDLADVENLE